jgi:DNA-binding transcriptional MerR regulator
MDEGLTIQETAERTGLSVDTLRYYERAGLLPNVLRTTGGQRRFDEANLGAIHFVTRMRCTGMPIRRIREYVEIGPDSGGGTRRRQLLVEHREVILRQMAELGEALALLDRKITAYDTSGIECRPETSKTDREMGLLSHSN